MAQKNVYLLCDYPGVLTKAAPDCKGRVGDNAFRKFHFSLSPDGTQCIAQGDFDDAFWQNPPAGCVVLSQADAVAQRVVWDKQVA